MPEHHHRTAGRKVRGLTALLLLAAALPARAIDTEPGNYIARPPGSNALSMILQHVERDAQYSHGHRLPTAPRLDTDMVTMKYAHYMKFGELTVAPGFIQSCGHTQAGGSIAALGGAGGCADLIAGAIVWAINDPARMTYLAISPYVVAPTGNYDANKPLNIGEHRWKGGINSGYVTPLWGKLMLDLVGDVVWNGKNTAYGVARRTLAQGAVFTAQMHLRYQFDAATRVSFSYLHDWGGETAQNGVDQNDRKNQGRYRIGAARFLDAHNQLQFELGADTRVANGYKEDRRIVLRYVRLY